MDLTFGHSVCRNASLLDTRRSHRHCHHVGQDACADRQCLEAAYSHQSEHDYADRRYVSALCDVMVRTTIKCCIQVHFTSCEDTILLPMLMAYWHCQSPIVLQYCRFDLRLKRRFAVWKLLFNNDLTSQQRESSLFAVLSNTSTL